MGKYKRSAGLQIDPVFEQRAEGIYEEGMVFFQSGQLPLALVKFQVLLLQAHHSNHVPTCMLLRRGCATPFELSPRLHAYAFISLLYSIEATSIHRFVTMPAGGFGYYGPSKQGGGDGSPTGCYCDGQPGKVIGS